MKATIWSKKNCQYCVDAKEMLIERGYQIDEIVIGINAKKEDLLKVVPDARTVPQIFLEDQHIGGCDALREYFKKTNT